MIVDYVRLFDIIVDHYIRLPNWLIIDYIRLSNSSIDYAWILSHTLIRCNSCMTIVHNNSCLTIIHNNRLIRNNQFRLSHSISSRCNIEIWWLDHCGSISHSLRSLVNGSLVDIDMLVRLSNQWTFIVVDVLLDDVLLVAIARHVVNVSTTHCSTLMTYILLVHSDSTTRWL